MANKSSLRVWIVSGQVILDLPDRPGKIEGDYMPIHPEHYKNYAHVKTQARNLDWSFICPGRVVEGEVGQSRFCMLFIGAGAKENLSQQVLWSQR